MAARGAETIDIEAVVLDWADKYFRRKIARDDKKLRELLDNELVRMSVDWKRVSFDHRKPEFKPEPPKPGSGKLKETCLFDTTFTNKTNSPQTYSFKAERSSRSACTVAIEEGYSQGIEVNLKLGLPNNILEANAGFHREINIATANEETTEEELTWGVDSQIRVEPRHTAEAKLMMTEEEFSSKFTLETYIQGVVKVNFFNLKDNNNFIRAIEGEIYRVIQDEMAAKSVRIPSNCKTFSISDRSVLCITNGKCRFNYGIRQSVVVDQYPMKS